MARHGISLEQLPLELIQIIFKCFSAKPHWSRQDFDYSTPLKTISLTSHSLRRSVFARLFNWIKINVTVAGQTLRPSHINVIRDLRVFIVKYRSQLRVEGLSLLIRVAPRDDQYKRFVSMARQFTTLKSFHYVSPFCTPSMMLRHVFTFLNCLFSLEEFRLVLVPGTLTTITKDSLELRGNQVAASYKKFARIARSKGNHQRLRLFACADYAPSELSVNVPGIIDQELVGWVNKGEGVWEKVGKEKARDDGKGDD